MGLEFGNLCRIVGITYYSLSPYEQKAFAGFFNPGFKNTMRRLRENLFMIGIPGVITALIISEAHDYHRKLNRKNPADYVNDV